MGEHTSFTERRAEHSERDLLQWKKVRFLATGVGETFKGRVTGVQPFGLFVQLDGLYVDGLVPIRTLADDYYVFEPDGASAGRTDERPPVPACRCGGGAAGAGGSPPSGPRPEDRRHARAAVPARRRQAQAGANLYPEAGSERTASAMSVTPVVAIVGRPNVGKSHAVQPLGRPPTVDRSRSAWCDPRPHRRLDRVLWPAGPAGRHRRASSGRRSARLEPPGRVGGRGERPAALRGRRQGGAGHRRREDLGQAAPPGQADHAGGQQG